LVRGAVLLRHWIPEFIKQVFPKFWRPVAPPGKLEIEVEVEYEDENLFDVEDEE